MSLFFWLFSVNTYFLLKKKHKSQTENKINKSLFRFFHIWYQHWCRRATYVPRRCVQLRLGCIDRRRKTSLFWLTQMSLTLSQQGETSTGIWRIWCDWLCLESESEAVRVGESESVRGATTMRVGERSVRLSVTAWGVKPCAVWGSEGRGWGLRRCELKWGSEGEEAGVMSWKMRELGLVFIAIYIYIYMGFFSNFMVIRSYPGRVSSFFDKTQTRFGFFFKTHTRPYSLSGQVKSSPLGSGRVRYLQVGSKFPSLKRCA